MTDEEREADAKGCYDLAIKVIGDGVKETGVLPECLLGDGEHSRSAPASIISGVISISSDGSAAAFAVSLDIVNL